MGYFSFITNDTKRSIPIAVAGRKSFPVHLWIPGKKLATEYGYDGYGDFGEYDYFEVFAELNKDHPAIQAYGYTTDMRARGCNVFHYIGHGQLKQQEFKFPQLAETDEEPTDFSVPPEMCPYQGLRAPEDDNG